MSEPGVIGVLRAAVVAAAACMAGCGGSDPVSSAQDAGSEDAIARSVVPTEHIPPVDPQQAPEASPDAAGQDDEWLASALIYRCESGEVIHARYDEATDTIRVRYRGVTVDTSPVMSASGARFAGGEWVWWSKGTEGTLFTLLPGDETGDVIERCMEVGAGMEGAEDAEDGLDDAEDGLKDAEDGAGSTGDSVEWETAVDDAGIDPDAFEPELRAEGIPTEDNP